MSNGKDNVILDRKFKERMAHKVNDFQEEVHDDVVNAKNYLSQKNSEFEIMVKDHPKSFVAGAFVGGFIVGTLFSKVNK